jgi:hypothetical protein
LKSANLSGFRPFAFAHVGFGLIYAESFDRNQDTASYWFRIGQFLNHQTFKPPEPFKTIARILTPPTSSPRCYALGRNTFLMRRGTA